MIAMRHRRATLLDVAKRAGVDRSVVSRLLTGDPRLSVRDDTRERVLAAVRALDYRPNVAARALRTTQSGALGLLIPDYANPVYAEVIAGAESEATNRGYLLLTGSSGGPGPGASAYEQFVAAGRVDGLMLAGANKHSRAFIADVNCGRVPAVLLNRRVPGARRWLILPDERGAELAVEHLLALGHTEIGFLAGPRDADTARRRLKGFLTALRSAGVARPERWVEAGNYSPAGGLRAFEALMSSLPRPTAVVVANVHSAIGALEGARRTGVAIPDDVSIVAIHDLELANYLSPSLTTVSLPLRRLGARGVEVLTTMPAGEPVTETVTGDTRIVVRTSTGPPAPSRARRRRQGRQKEGTT